MKTKEKRTIYEKCFKRLFDILLASLVLLFFWWVYLILIIVVKINMGGPVFFKQPRPGKKGKDGESKIFYLVKFRSMLNTKDENGELLPDEERLTKFGRWIRATSLDELPEVFNILKGDMSFVGPRPLLVKDLLFMDNKKKERHNVRPGLTGLTQVSGRNSLDWEDRFECDLNYIQKITFWKDLKIMFKTIPAVLKKEGINDSQGLTGVSYGDYLLALGKISKEEYDEILNKNKQ